MFAAALLLIIVVAFRVIIGVTHMEQDHSWLHNFSPVAAVALCGAAYFPRRLAFVLPLGALLVSDIILNSGRAYNVAFFTLEIVPRYLAIAMVAALGWKLRGNPAVGRVMGASVIGSTLFYVFTNTASWLGEPAYSKTFAGWAQALTTGLPNVHPTTLEFYRGTFVSDIVFTALFIVCMTVPRRAEAPMAHAHEPA